MSPAPTPRQDPPQRHSPYTFEGQIEGLADFATGLRRHRSGAKKRIAIALVLSVILLPLWVGVVQALAAVIGWLFG